MLVESGNYNYIWIDVGNVYPNPWRLMEVCDRVFMPEPLDYIGRRKVSQMENYLMASGRGELLSRFTKVYVPYDDKISGYDISCEMLLRPEWGAYINKLMGGVNSG